MGSYLAFLEARVSGVEKWFILTLSSQCDQNCNHGRARGKKQYELTEDDTTTFFLTMVFSSSLLVAPRWKSQQRTLMDLLLHFSEWLKSSVTLVATYSNISFIRSKTEFHQWMGNGLCWLKSNLALKNLSLLLCK